jgi:DNA-binding NarL/FixJ family response regulator
MAIRIILAEDHAVVRTAVASYLARHPDLEVVGEVGEGGPALFRIIGERCPDVLLLDAHMPGHTADVVESARSLKERWPDMAILVLSAYNRREYVVGLLKAGAAGYVLKDDSPDMLLQAIRIVAEGGEWVSPRVANVLVDSMRHGEPEPFEVLSNREMDVLRAVAQGLTNRQIAAELYIGEQTVKNHVSSIFSKLRVDTRVQAVLYALRHGLVSAEHDPDNRF